MSQDAQDRINAIMQLVNAEMEAIARRQGKRVDPIEKMKTIKAKIIEAGLPLPEHLK